MSVSSSRKLRFRALSLWGNIPGLYSGLPPWRWIHRSEWALSLLPILWGLFGCCWFFWAVWGWWDSLPCLLLLSFFILAKNTGNKKRDRLGPLFAVLIACFTRSFLRFVLFWLWPSGMLWRLSLPLVPGLVPKCRTSAAALLMLSRFRVPRLPGIEQ